MCIKKQVIWDKQAHKFIGYCDYGGNLTVESSETAATEALVFMLVSLNDKWKLPIGYFFQNKSNAVRQAELIKTALTLSQQSELKVRGITCDGAFTNFSTFKILGCEFGEGFNNIKSWFSHPIDGSQIFFIPDACHMIKLARNTLGNSLVLETDTSHIKWCYFEYLHEIQLNLSLKFANKITGVHLNLQNNKMKVKFAVQLLSSSTAKAMQYLKKNNYNQFKDSDETIVFCQTIDQLFDFLNSRNPFSKGYKSPIFKSNLTFLKSKLIPFINYLYSLKHKNKLLFTTNKKTFI